MASEVPTRQLLTIIDALEEESADAEAFLAACGIGDVAGSGSLDPVERVDWDDYAALMAAALERWGADGLAALGARSVHADMARTVRDGVVIAFASGRDALEGFLGGALGASTVIHCLDIDCRARDERTLALRSRMAPGFAPSPGHEHYSAGIYAELPRLFHERRAVVETTLTEDGAEHLVHFARRGAAARLRTRLDRSRPRPEFLAELRATFDHFNRRQAQLQTEAEKSRQMEAMLHQAQKMQAVGTLTGGIAHDFNNLLAVILGQLDLLAETTLDGEQREMLDDATEAARRSARLAGQLLSFSRQADHRLEAVDANASIRALGELAARTLAEGVDLQLELTDDAWAVETDPARLENAVLNLAINACDAMEDSGALTIRTGNVHLDDARVAGEDGFLPAGDYLRVSVVDTGHGMDEDLARHAFEPFFTTKPRGAGTGLGLAMVWRFANESGGSAEIVSAPGQGTTVHVYLPRSRRTPAPVQPVRRMPATDPAPREPATDDGTSPGAAPVIDPRRLLVLEDQDDVRRVVTRILEREGYRVVPTANGADALAELRADDQLGLMLCDVMLPGGSLGPDVVARAREFRPELRVVFMSGYAGEAAQQPGRIEPRDPLLPKPLSRDALVDALDRIRTEAPAS